MKRNWIPYVAITAALVAGTICSTALAKGPNKGGFKFSGGSAGSIRSMQPSSRISSMPRNLNTNKIHNLNNGNFQKFNQTGGAKFNSPVLGGRINNKPVFNKQPISGHINKHVLGGQINKPVFNKQPIGGQIHKPLINKPHVGSPINKPLVGISTKDLGGKFGQNIVKHKIDVNISKQIGNGIIHCNPVPTNPHCPPKCDTGKKHCFPWWCLPNYDPWCKPCYPKVCSQPIVVQVPVAVPVEVPVAVPVSAATPAPAAPAEPLMQIPVGSTLTLQAQGLGEAAGQVMVVMDKISLPSQINEWRPDAVTATLPIFGLAAPTPAQLILLSAEGQVISSMDVELTPASPEVAAAGEGNAAELATAALGQ